MTRVQTRHPSFRLRRSIGRILVVGSVLVTAAANGGAVAADGDDAYAVGTGDLLKVVVYNDDRLSGEFRVDAEGAISYPILGTVAVGEMTTGEIGRSLAARLAGQVPLSGTPAVQVIEYAPVYVVGDVTRPGPYPFRPQMIALELVSLAGGFRLPAELESRMLQLISAEQALRDTELTKAALLIRRARLQAEIAERTFDESSLADALVTTETRNLVADEVALFEIRRDVFAAQLKGLDNQRTSFDREIESLRQSIELHDEEIRLLETEVATAAGLVDKGLSTQSRLLEVRRQLSAMKRDALELRSFLARAHQGQLNIDQRVIELNAIRDGENAEALREVDLSLSRANRALAAGAAAVDQLRIEMNRPRGTLTRSPDYTIIRAIDGERRSIPIDELSAVRPGDILRVESAAPSAGLALAVPGEGL